MGPRANNDKRAKDVGPKVPISYPHDLLFVISIPGSSTPLQAVERRARKEGIANSSAHLSVGLGVRRDVAIFVERIPEASAQMWYWRNWGGQQLKAREAFGFWWIPALHRSCFTSTFGCKGAPEKHPTSVGADYKIRCRSIDFFPQLATFPLEFYSTMSKMLAIVPLG